MNGYGAISGVARDSRESSVDLPGVREADQPGVGDDLEFQRNPPLLAVLARLELRAGRGWCELLKWTLPRPPLAALRDDDLVAGFDQVLEHVAAIAVADDGAGRHEQDDVLGVLARRTCAAIPASPFLAFQCFFMVRPARLSAFGSARMMTEPPSPPSPPSGPPLGTYFSRRNGRGPAASVPALHEEFDAIDEH